MSLFFRYNNVYVLDCQFVVSFYGRFPVSPDLTGIAPLVYLIFVLHTKALYNLLRLNLRQDPSIPHERWAVEDLRSVGIETLFSRLGEKGVAVSRETFLHFSEGLDSPEALAEVLFPDGADEEDYDPAYLLLFELWRRLLPERPSLSIFCDEIDHRLDLYDQGLLENDEPIQNILAKLEEVLEENALTGENPRELFASLEEACAHDVERFLYDYIRELIDLNNLVDASGLVDAFSSYVTEPIWFELLSARLLSFEDTAAAERSISQILDESPPLPILLEIFEFLPSLDERSLFPRVIQQASSLLETEEDFSEMLHLSARYYRLLDCDLFEEKIQQLVHKRKIPLTQPFHAKDPDLDLFLQICIK